MGGAGRAFTGGVRWTSIADERERSGGSWGGHRPRRHFYIWAMIRLSLVRVDALVPANGSSTINLFSLRVHHRSKHGSQHGGRTLTKVL